jgi:catechol 2,3-dioxygenase-like lactoylglutathione lyase family enzyme
MRKNILLAIVIALLAGQRTTHAQLAAPNDSGVSIGHVHLFSRDPDAQKKIWVEAFGAQVTKTGTLELLRLPGGFVIINKAEPSGGSAGSTADHLGLSVRDLSAVHAKLAALNVQVQGPFAALPDGVRLELLEEKNQTLPAVLHHIHLAAANGEMLRQWYVKTFGAEMGSRQNLPSATFYGNEVDFMSAGGTRPAATKGRALDHIGFEVNNLEAFVQKLQGSGVTIEIPYRNMPNLDLKVAVIIDPVGTRIELTEGLRGK